MKLSIDAFPLGLYRVRMTSQTRNLEKEAKTLGPKERARLALRLIESLDPGTDEDAEQLWLEEAERRLSEYDAGGIEAQSVDDVISEIERQLR